MICFEKTIWVEVPVRVSVGYTRGQRATALSPGHDAEANAGEILNHAEINALLEAAVEKANWLREDPG